MSPSQEEKFFAAAREQAAHTASAPEGGAKPARGWRYYARRTVIYLVGGYLLLCALLFIFQKKIVYQPQRESSLLPKEHGFAPQQAQAVEIRTSDGLMIRGWQMAGRGAKEPATMDLSSSLLVDLFFCGNAGNKSDRFPIFKRLTALGATVVCFDYRGYGDSDGSPDEEGLARDARAAWDFLRSKGAPPERIVLHGESLGSAVAVRLAAELCAEGAPPAGLILEAPFTRLKDVAKRHYPFVPVSLILRQEFPSVERIPKVLCPILILHGRRDDLIPVTIGRELFAAAPENSSSGMAKQFVELPSCGHNDIGTVDSEEYNAALKAFFTARSPALAAPRPEGTETRRPRQPKARPE